MNSMPTVLAWMPQGWEWLIILLIVVLLFGARKLPDLARGIGQSIKEFRKGAKEGHEEKPAAKTEEPKKGNGQ